MRALNYRPRRTDACGCCPLSMAGAILTGTDDCSNKSTSNETITVVNVAISQPSLLPMKPDLALIIGTKGSMCNNEPSSRPKLPP
mmetsp:Transcript_36148/g.36381  ORF Transcript_36148/g.36381 Transcript_36148/m.36381 type:complete len:85 (+) Transcript_36148:146-400(+)